MNTKKQKGPATHMEEIDALRWEKQLMAAQLIEFNIQTLNNQREQIKAMLVEIERQLTEKYSLTPADRVDLATRTIQRAPAPAPVAPKKVSPRANHQVEVIPAQAASDAS